MTRSKEQEAAMAWAEKRKQRLMEAVFPANSAENDPMVILAALVRELEAREKELDSRVGCWKNAGLTAEADSAKLRQRMENEHHLLAASERDNGVLRRDLEGALKAAFNDREYAKELLLENQKLLERVAELMEAWSVFEPHLSFVYDELGVYPQAIIGGENAYEKRTPEMEEHNEKVTASIKAKIALRAVLAKHDKGQP